MFDRRDIFKWLVFHRLFSFPGCMFLFSVGFGVMFLNLESESIYKWLAISWMMIPNLYVNFILFPSI